MSGRGQPLGQTLLRKGLIGSDDLKNVLEEQKQNGLRMGEMLIGDGKLSYYTFYKTLAEHLGCAFVDLVKHPPDEVLVDEKDKHIYMKYRFIPWRRDGDMVVLATPNITPDIRKWANRKYNGKCILAITSPYDIFWSLQYYFNESYDSEARNKLWQLDPRLSARTLLSPVAVINIILVLAILLMSVYYFSNMVGGLFLAINIFFLVTLAFKLIFFVTGKGYNKELQEREYLPDFVEKTLPTYTILIPLYKEKRRTIEMLVASVRALDYPKSKLDVKLIVEDDDADTTNIIKSLSCENFFEIIRVPFSLPRTKPKACNYALQFARGDYVTIYDAEDMPDPKQLLKAIAMFEKSDDRLGCVQAKLNYYNASENILTRLFAIEYSAWFEFMLYGLQVLKIPMPLGGTSNHFPIEVLEELYAWDPYNVTEDADLGIRLVQKGYTTAIINSTTMEEAPTSIGSWLRQRSRWIKGYLQTYIVHMRQPISFLKKTGWIGFLGFQFFVGAPCAVYLMVPIVIIVSILAYMGDITLLSEGVLYLAILNFLYGGLLHFYFSVEVICKHKWWRMLPYSIIFPFYWLLHSLASFKAFWQLMTRPHYWEKTNHGESSFVRQIADIA